VDEVIVHHFIPYTTKFKKHASDAVVIKDLLKTQREVTLQSLVREISVLPQMTSIDLSVKSPTTNRI
jgi:hypothetical protein